MTMYKKQVEEAEEIAALNLAKFRQVQGNMSDAQERADLSELALARIKACRRSKPMVKVTLVKKWCACATNNIFGSYLEM